VKAGRVAALDGLRACAIVLVVSGHALSGEPPGNFLGVDLFFVLSGFLITTLLLEEHDRRGRISARGFYGRRCRRLLPALALLLAVYIVIAELFRPERVRPLAEAAVGITYFSNFFLLQGGKGFAASLAHLWSLAAEEQFYILWPLVIVVLAARPRSLIAVTLSVIIALIAWQLHYAIEGQGGGGGLDARFWYAPDTRSTSPILIGALLAMLCRADFDRVSRVARPLFWPSLIGAAVFVVAIPPYRFGGWYVIFALACAVLLVRALDGNSRWASLLSRRPAEYTGRISYSLYLYHFPLLWLVWTWALPWRLGMTVAAFVLAGLSYHLVEQPFLRRGKRAVTVPEPEPTLINAH
jgi:peptidoglycan/LPS O-acetylase OafA/YrhL